MFRWLLNLFWTDFLWLPSGVIWEDVTNGPDQKVVYPDFKDWIYHILLLTATILILRYVLENYCFCPIGKALGVKGKKRRKIQMIPQLEAIYRSETSVFNLLKDLVSVRGSKRQPDQGRNNTTSMINIRFARVDLQGLEKELDMSQRQIERWWRLRRCKDKAAPLTKFCEHGWKACHLSCVIAFGLYVLWDKEYFWKFDNFLIGFPHQGITNDIWWLNMIQTAYYWSLLITYFRDVRRKDFWQMFLHHVLGTLVLTFSGVTQFYRLIAVSIPLMEVSEAVLELAKAVKRAGYNNTAVVLYFNFVAVWLVTRFYILPVHFFYTITFSPYSYLSRSSPAAIVGNLLLYMLIALQIYWTVFILQVAYNFLAYGNQRDTRSSSSEISEDTSSNICRKNGSNEINNNKMKKGDMSLNSGLVNGEHQNGVNGKTECRARAQNFENCSAW